MKPSTKRRIAISCSVFALGCFLIAAGWGMGGRLYAGSGGVHIGGTDGIYLGPEGIRIGGSDGICVGPYGISIGGTDGIMIGQYGIAVGGNNTEYLTALVPIDQIEENENVYAINGGTLYGQEEKLDKFLSAEINIEFGGIRVEQGADYGIEFSGNVPGYSFHYENLDGALTIWSEDSGQKRTKLDEDSICVTLTVPAGVKLQFVDFRTSLGDIFWRAKSSVDEAYLSTDLGSIYWVGESNAASVRMESRCGNVEIAYLNAAELNIACDLGDIRIEIPDIASDNISYDLCTELGEISMGYSVHRGGEYHYTAKDEKYHIEAICALGDIIVSKINRE